MAVKGGHKHIIAVPREIAVVMHRAWKADYDDEGYDFPYINMWARYRLGAADITFDRHDSHPYTVYFDDDQASVEFKLRWL